MILPANLLRRSPQEAARFIALERIAEARAACRRLADPEDAEALHEFRVAVRRLRSALAQWRPELGKSIARRHRRALRSLQAETGAGRDAEVALAWLHAQRDHLAPAQRRGCDWLVQRLDERRREAKAPLRQEVGPRFEAIASELVPRLERMRVEVHLLEPETGPGFGEVFAARARDGVEALAELLDSVRGLDDRQRCHRARIACKRLRYLVEPLRPRTRESLRVVTQCKRLQNLLGDLQDAFVLQDEVARALEETSVEQARRLLDLARDEDPERMRRESRRGERSGLLELARRLGLRVRKGFELLEKHWLGPGTRRLVDEVEAMAGRLESRAGGAVEIERKFLLRALPEMPEPLEVLEVEQGWLPGERLRERLRRTRRGEKLAYFRGVKLGQGVRRIEIEEPTTRELFESLWPLTEGCRIRKRRHVVGEGRLVWEVDEFLDRPLVLAEVELASAATRPELPEWLARVSVREVTDDPRYTNLHLAGRAGEVPGEG